MEPPESGPGKELARYSLSEMTHFEKRIDRFSISPAELLDNKNNLAVQQEADQERYLQTMKQAGYATENSIFPRIYNFITRKGKLPDQTPSPQTDLLQSIVDIQEELKKGYDHLQALPNILQDIAKQRDDLAQQKADLEERLAKHYRLTEKLPEEELQAKRFIVDLMDYEHLTEESRSDLVKSIEDSMKEKSSIPALSNPKVRERLIEFSETYLTESKKQLLTPEEIVLLQADRSMLEQDQIILHDQVYNLIEGYKPAIAALHKLKMNYDRLRRFAPAAHLAIGLNQVREETIDLIAKAEEAMAVNLELVEESRFSAESAEQADQEVRGILKDEQ